MGDWTRNSKFQDHGKEDESESVKKESCRNKDHKRPVVTPQQQQQQQQQQLEQLRMLRQQHHQQRQNRYVNSSAPNKTFKSSTIGVEVGGSVKIGGKFTAIVNAEDSNVPPKGAEKFTTYDVKVRGMTVGKDLEVLAGGSHKVVQGKNASASSRDTGDSDDEEMNDGYHGNRRRSKATPSGGQAPKRARYDLKMKGFALIVNMLFNGRKPKVDPDEVEKYKTNHRAGAEDHTDRWEKLFKKQFNCQTFTHENVSSTDWPRLRDQFKEMAKSGADSCFVLLMTHGMEDNLLMDDLKWIHFYEDVLRPFNRDNFPEFANRPKIFLVQACKENRQNFSPSSSPHQPSLMRSSSSSPAASQEEGVDEQPFALDQWRPTAENEKINKDGSRLHDDILIAWATVPLTLASRGLFLECAEKTFKDYQEDVKELEVIRDEDGLDLVSMLKKVDEGMKEAAQVYDQTLNLQQFGFHKDYYFFYDN